tara:strand:- start:194 stop:832 length:639 start_codon:yes stop_codon:yes gene_type:complete
MSNLKKLEKLFKSSIKKKDLGLFNQALLLNDSLNLIPAQDITSMVANLFGAKTAVGWKNAMDFNEALDDYLKVSEAFLTKMYLPLVGKMSWNSTPSHLKEEWWNEVGTRHGSFVAKRKKVPLNKVLTSVSPTGIVLDWSDVMLSEKYNPETGRHEIVERKPFTTILEIFYENGRIEQLSSELGIKRGSSKITTDQTASSIAKGLNSFYKFIY